MSPQEKDSIMIMAAKENSTVNESMDVNVARQEAATFQNKLSRYFIGVNDGIRVDDILAIAVLSVVTTMVQTGNMTPNLVDIMFLILKILGIFAAFAYWTYYE